MENQQAQQQLKPRMKFMDKYPQTNFVGYEKHPDYVENSDSDSDDEEDPR